MADAAARRPGPGAGAGAAWPDIAGRLLPEGGHVLPVRVYFEDTDFTGIVYHANYLKYFERGRSDFLRLKGVDHSALIAGETGESLAFAVRHMAIDFRAPARIDDVLAVETQVAEIAGARLVLDQQVVKEKRVLASARVTIAMIAPDARPRRIPALVRQRLG